MQSRNITRELNYKYLMLKPDDRLKLAVEFDLVTYENSNMIGTDVYQSFLKRAKELGKTEELLNRILASEV